MISTSIHPTKRLGAQNQAMLFQIHFGICYAQRGVGRLVCRGAKDRTCAGERLLQQSASDLGTLELHTYAPYQEPSASAFLDFEICINNYSDVDNKFWYPSLYLLDVMLEMCRMDGITLTFTPHYPPGKHSEDKNTCSEIPGANASTPTVWAYVFRRLFL